MKNTENGNFRLYTNSGLGIGGTILMALLIVIIIYLYQYGGGGIGGLICCGSMAVLWLASWLLCAPKWYANIEFTQEGLIFRAPFRKTKLIPYKCIHIYPASYIHVCVEVPYIVFSTKIMSNYELTHINNVPNTSEVIPIEYSRKHYEKLLKVLPPEGRAMLRAAFDGKYEQEMQKKDSQGKK